MCSGHADRQEYPVITATPARTVLELNLGLEVHLSSEVVSKIV